MIKTKKHCRPIYYEQKSRAKRRKSLLQGHWMLSFSSCVMQHTKRSIKRIPPPEITTFHTWDIRIHEHFTDMHHRSPYWTYIRQVKVRVIDLCWAYLLNRRFHCKHNSVHSCMKSESSIENINVQIPSNTAQSLFKSFPRNQSIFSTKIL